MELQARVEARQPVERVLVCLGEQIREGVVDVVRRRDDETVAFHRRLRFDETQTDVSGQRERSELECKVHLAVPGVADLAIIKGLGRVGGRRRAGRGLAVQLAQVADVVDEPVGIRIEPARYAEPPIELAVRGDVVGGPG